MTELWQDDLFRQALLGLTAMVVISLCKKFSLYAATNTAFKYGAVVVLSALAASYSQLWNVPVVEWSEFFKELVRIGMMAIVGHQTIGKIAASLLEQYKVKRNG